jgi:hypothetical protein
VLGSEMVWELELAESEMVLWRPNDQKRSSWRTQKK